MEPKLSSRIQSLSTSQTIAMAERAAELKSEGVDIISLSLGEPDFDTPEYIVEAAKKAMDEKYFKYPPIVGYKDLREAIVHKLKRDNHLDYHINQIVVSTGSKQSIFNAAMVLVSPGDEVLLPSPYWVSYYEIAKLVGGVPKPIKTTIENDFKITPEQLEQAIGPKTKLMIFNTPSNPSGSVYSKAELEALGEVLQKHPNVYVISDEIYEYINFTGSFASFAEIDTIKDRIITINGVSKAFAMTGWRVGYMAAHPTIAQACAKIQSQVTSGANSIAQKATIAALNGGKEKIQYMIDAFDERRQLVYELLKEIPGFKVNMPTGAFYFFPDVQSFFGKTFNGVSIRNATDLSMYLLEEAKVATVTGEAFGNPECLRFSYATSKEELIDAFGRVKKALRF
jgi:aspartate aminotransferase